MLGDYQRVQFGPWGNVSKGQKALRLAINERVRFPRQDGSINCGIVAEIRFRGVLVGGHDFLGSLKSPKRSNNKGTQECTSGEFESA